MGRKKIKQEKEFLYVGHYIDTQGRYILKIGTTNDLKRRAIEHSRNYHNAKEYTLPPNAIFVYDWSLPLSKYNTIRYEDKNRTRWKEENIGEFVRNDRFYCKSKPDKVRVVIRKTYEIPLGVD
jgi:hypothetical protein